MPQLNFNAANQEAVNLDNTVVKKGWYPTMITKSDIQPTKDQTGSRLELALKILDGPDKDKSIFVGFNIQNKSEAATRIGMGMLTTLALAVRMPQFTQTEQLHNIPFLTKFKIDHQEGYDPKNDVVNFKPVNEHGTVVMAWLDTSEEVVSTPRKPAAPKTSSPFASQNPPEGSAPPFTAPANSAPMTAGNVGNDLGVGTATDTPPWMATDTAPQQSAPAQEQAPQQTAPQQQAPTNDNTPAWAR